MFVYCKRCGLIKKAKETDEQCDVCEIAMTEVPSEYLNKSGFMFVSQELRKQFEDKIRQGEEFDTEAYENRDRILKEKEQLHNEQVAQKVEEYHNNRVKIACPVCHSESLDKISNVGKVVKVGVFGILGAGDIGKKYRCNSCGYRF